MTQCIYKDVKDPIGESRALQYSFLGNGDSKLEEIQPILKDMKEGPIKQIILRDPLITDLGHFQTQKYGVENPLETRQCMRQMARLVQKAEEIDESVNSLEKLLIPEKFDLLLDCTKKLMKESKDESAPSIGRRIVYTIKKAVNVLRGRYIRRRDSVNENVSSTLVLIDNEWNTRVSSKAAALLQERQRNRPNILPLTEDLIKLTEYIVEKITRLISDIKDNFTMETWFALAKFVLVRIVVFNRKRTGEASRMLVNDFERGLKPGSLGTTVLKTLSSTEQSLAKRMMLVEIKGKRGNVPVLLNEEMVDALKLLLTMRQEHEINLENKFFFPSTATSKFSMRGSAILRKCTLDAKLQVPEAITGTQLRKYMATSLIVLTLEI